MSDTDTEDAPAKAELTDEQVARMALANKQLNMVKINLTQKKATMFIATVAFSLRHVIVDPIKSAEMGMDTAGTNAHTVWYNVDFWLSLSAQQKLWLLLHETWHVAFDHCRAIKHHRGTGNTAQGTRQAELAASKVVDKDGTVTQFSHQLHNVACDHVINLMLNASGEIPVDQIDICADARFENMSSEAVYKQLASEEKAEPGSGVPKDYQGDLHEIPGTDEDRAAHKADLDDTLVKAAMKHDMAGGDPGAIPGDIRMHLDDLVNPTVPWDRVLLRYFTSRAKTDWSFRKPNRRFFPKHLLPSANSEALGRVAMAIDLSGSVSDQEVTKFISDVGYVINQLPMDEMTLLQFDTRVRAEIVIRNKDDLMEVDFGGRGGTDIEPVMAWGREHVPDVLVVFTDGYFRLPDADEAPPCPVLWVIHENEGFAPEFGEVIHYSVFER